MSPATTTATSSPNTAAAADDPAHTPTFVASKKYPNLFSVFCSCGKSSYGSSLRPSAEQGHAEHVKRPHDDTYRDEAATQTLLDIIDPERRLIP